MLVYKLFRKTRKGLQPLFINKKQVLEIGQWYKAQCYPTRGYATRTGWHCTLKPEAEHLSMKDRIWCECEVSDCYEFQRPKNQGGTWIIAQNIKINKVLE